MTINMRWRERGEIDDNDDVCRRGGAARAKIGGKGWQGDNEGDDCGRVSHFFVAQELRLMQRSFRMGCGFATPTAIADYLCTVKRCAERAK